MKTHLRLTTLVLLLAAPAAFARVLSYAPYSAALASRAQQSRTARHVLAVEPFFGGAAIKLYDTTGAEEPRVIDQVSNVPFAAMYEAQDATPVILVGERLTRDLGKTWISVALGGLSVGWPFDQGGPFARGLNAPIQIGTADYPFVIALASNIIAVAPDGGVRALTSTPARIIGRNREGTRFLIESNANVAILELDGRTAPVASDLVPEAGWITSEGSAYTLTRNNTGALRLRFHEHQQETFKTGRDGFFAMPTHDFEGAWMIQQDDGDPTTLSRYYPGRGQEDMWSDPSGRKIEALIAGASGQTLLIQTPKPRTAVDTPFRGVGLALWRVGDPAPDDYDELLARLGVGHGFAHVDPDTLLAGSTFVFDTAFTGTEKPDRLAATRPTTAGGADVLQEWGIVRGTIKQRVVLPTVSRIPGGYGTNWLTDVTLYNPLGTAQDVAVRFESTTKTLTLDPHEIRVVPDVLQTLFAVARGGGPLFFEPAKAMTVTSRTYTPKGNGSLGFIMDAIDATNTASSGFGYGFAGAFPNWHFRTNMLLTDLSGRGSAAVVHGSAMDMGIEVAPNATVNLGRVDPLLGTRSGIFVAPVFGNLMTTVVAIDNFTNDATYFPPDLPMNARMGRTFPGMAHIDFPDGSKLRTDLYVLNTSDEERYVPIEGKQLGDSGWTRGSYIRLAPYESKIIREAPQALLMLHGRSRLRYGATSSVRLTSRTYYIDPDGGTRGMITPPLNNFQFASEGESLELVAQAGNNLRMSLALLDMTVLPNGDPAVVRIHLIDDKGKTLDSFEQVLFAAQGIYLDDVFKSRNVTQPAAARIVVDIIRATGLVGGYGVLQDSATGDLFYVSANHGGRP